MGMSFLLVSGSLRAGSTNSAVLRTVRAIAPTDVTTTLYDAMERLPHFNPDNDVEPLQPDVAALRAAIGTADAVLFCTPEYAGALPGAFKNLLDWSVGGAEMYGKPVAWINASFGPTGGAEAHASLRKVLGYVGAKIVEGACAQIAVTRDLIGTDGLVVEGAVRDRLRASVRALTAYHPIL